MKSVFAIALAASAVSCMQKPVRVDGIPDDFSQPILNTPNPLRRIQSTLFPDQDDRAFRLEKMADLVVEYDTSGGMSADPPKTYERSESKPAAELVGFFDSQTRKTLVVVIVAKNVWSDAELARHLAFLNGYFADRGYRRVVIQQASGGGRPTHSDTTFRNGKPIHFPSTTNRRGTR